MTSSVDSTAGSDIKLSSGMRPYQSPKAGQERYGTDTPPGPEERLPPYSATRSDNTAFIREDISTKGVLEQLNTIRAKAGDAIRTTGLGHNTISQLVPHFPALVEAVTAATQEFQTLEREHPDLMKLGEMEQIEAIEKHLVNFYPEDTVNPYVPLAARGPWIVTTKGAVLHDNGGYGMLGFGHVPAAVMDAMAKPQVMANVMTPSVSQFRLVEALKREIGQTRNEGCPYTHFLAMNSGSESVSVATRISDVNAKILTDEGGRHHGRDVAQMSLAGGFHGRTGRPAQFSDSTGRTNQMYLATFRDVRLLTVEPNNIVQLRARFEGAEAQNYFIEAFFMEPVMGEGNPGVAITPEFYAEARRLTKAHGSLLLVDSIQAGLRTTGYLSVVDSPGFQGLEAPDMETYSKAINAGQYPLSILAMTDRAAKLYRKGIYGNTMTANPRAMDIGSAVLKMATPAVRQNIVDRGHEFVDKLKALMVELDGPITKVEGTGLLFSCEVSPDYKAYGKDSLEEYMRTKGVGVVHGGKNSLRFTPHFCITSKEVDLIIEAVKDAVINGPKAGAGAQTLHQKID